MERFSNFHVSYGYKFTAANSSYLICIYFHENWLHAHKSKWRLLIWLHFNELVQVNTNYNELVAYTHLKLESH